MLEPHYVMRIAHAVLVDFCMRCLRVVGMRSATKAAVVERIYLPGEMEWAFERETNRHGVSLTALTVDSLKGLAADVRVDGPF